MGQTERRAETDTRLEDSLYDINDVNFRHKVYVLALEIYVEYIDPDAFHSFGLCGSISRSLKYFINDGNVKEPFWNLSPYKFEIYKELSPYYNMHLWKEVYEHKPKTNGGGDYWFPLDDNLSRIKILEDAIEKTKCTI